MVQLFNLVGEHYIYWSKSDAFMLPLTGVQKDTEFPINSYLFWNKHSIEDYKLILCISYDQYEEFLGWCKNYLFPIMDKKGYLLESYDFEATDERPKRTVFVLDISEWAMDIEQFLAGKYSMLTKGAKDIIQKFHTFGKSPNHRIPLQIYTTLFPNLKIADLKDDNKILTPIEYAAKFYNWNIEDLQKIGEIGSIYDKMEETLITDVEEFCQSGSKVASE